jgi:hypothetical protein
VAAEQPVVAGAAVQVGAVGTFHPLAQARIVALAGVDHVVAIPAVQLVVAAVADHLVVAAKAVHLVVTRRTNQRFIVAERAVNFVHSGSQRLIGFPIRQWLLLFPHGKIPET